MKLDSKPEPGYFCPEGDSIPIYPEDEWVQINFQGNLERIRLLTFLARASMEDRDMPASSSAITPQVNPSRRGRLEEHWENSLQRLPPVWLDISTRWRAWPTTFFGHQSLTNFLWPPYEVYVEQITARRLT